MDIKIHKLFFPIFICFISEISISSEYLDISNIKFYQTNYRFDTQKEDLIAYVLKDDPCITVRDLDENKTKRYCEMGNSGINLEIESPTSYVADLYVSPGSIRFIVAAPWNEQKCKILAFHEEITCEPTGKN